MLMAHKSRRHEIAGLHRKWQTWAPRGGGALGQSCWGKAQGGLWVLSWSLCPRSVPLLPTPGVHGVAHFQCLIWGVPEPSISWEHGTTLSTADRQCVSTSRECGGVAGWAPGHGVEP